jgi:hypothetical protein
MLATAIAILLQLLTLKTDVTVTQRNSADQAITRQDAMAISIVVDELQN